MTKYINIISVFYNFLQISTLLSEKILILALDFFCIGLLLNKALIRHQLSNCGFKINAQLFTRILGMISFFDLMLANDCSTKIIEEKCLIGLTLSFEFLWWKNQMSHCLKQMVNCSIKSSAQNNIINVRFRYV